MSNETIRVRIAPSPTGNLHIGTARTALYNYLYAHHNGGRLILRIEDTDAQRSTKEYENDIYLGLDWLGISPDEGPKQGGDFGPYRQSERAHLYSQAAERLLGEGKAYPCFCTPEHLEEGRKKAQSENRAYIYPGTCRHLSKEEISKNRAEGKPSVLRFTVPHDRMIRITDLVKGNVEFHSSLIGDFVIQRADGVPLYSLANVVDDSAMQITHVLRGEDLLPSTPNQIVLYEALELTPPKFGHLPLLLNPDRTKLSKRKGATAVAEFRREGYLAEALVNFIAFLGWSPGTEEEFFMLDRLVKAFSLERVQHSGAVFDERRLRYINAHYLKEMDDAVLLRHFREWLEARQPGKLGEWEAQYETFRRAVPIAKERAETLADLNDPFGLFITPAQDYSKESLCGASPQFADRSDAERVSLFETVIEELEQETFSVERLSEWINHFLGSHQLLKPELLAPLRIALTGRKQSPGVAEMLYVFGKEESLSRLRDALQKLKS
jgi:nondiscriminating glutamyl-tRNA synthetase